MIYAESESSDDFQRLLITVKDGNFMWTMIKQRVVFLKLPDVEKV